MPAATTTPAMNRAQILATMNELKLFGMRSAYDEIIRTAVKRAHEPQQVVGDLLGAEIAEKHARSIKYQMTIAKLPLAKDVAEFEFASTPINEGLVRDLVSTGPEVSAIVGAQNSLAGKFGGRR